MSVNIKEIKNAGILDVKDFDLKKYNLIYGNNGSGKTTFSRILSLIGGNDVDNEIINRIKLNNQNPSIKINSEQFIISENFDNKFEYEFVVFNKDFVDKNVFTKNGLNKIIISQELGEIKDRKIALEDCKKSIEELEKRYRNDLAFSEIESVKGLVDINSLLKNLESAEENSRKDFANEIIKKTLEGDYRNYNKSILKEDISRLEEAGLSSVKQKASYEENLSLDDLKSKIISKKAEISTEKNKIEFHQLDALAAIIEKLSLELSDVDDLLSRQFKIPNSQIDSLSGEIKKWIEEGLEIHQDKEDDCWFCGNKLGDRIIELKNSFDDSYKSAKEEINKYLAQINDVKKSISDFKHSDNITLPENFAELKDGLIKYCDYLLETLKLKKELKMSESVAIENSSDIQEKISKFQDNINDLKDLYQKYNVDVDNQERIKKDELEKLKNTLVIWFLENKFNNRDSYQEIVNNYQKIDNLIKQKYKELEGEIINKLDELNSSHSFNLSVSKNDDLLFNPPNCIFEAIQELNNESANIKIPMSKIENYFKEIINTDLKLEENKDENGIVYFKIKRGLLNDAHLTLSEGEKTALAFSYYLTKLDELEQSSDGKNKVVVIDDPISSLDYNVLYSIYNMIYNKIYKVKRFNKIIVLTHNWYFANLIFNGILKAGKGLFTEKNQEGEGCFYELSRKNDGKSNIVKKDSGAFLENEYDYLLKYILEVYDKLKKKEEVDLYAIGNSCRRFAELFCKFYHHDKSLESLLGSENSGLTRFLHNTSHGQDTPDKAAINFTPDECLKNIEILLKVVIDKLNNEDSCKVRRKLSKRFLTSP